MDERIHALVELLKSASLSDDDRADVRATLAMELSFYADDCDAAGDYHKAETLRFQAAQYRGCEAQSHPR